jgi:site-specific DNA-methyltransferase (adenine-specific)
MKEASSDGQRSFLKIDEVHCGDAPALIEMIAPESIALSVWSPPYHVGKKYEKNNTFDDWKSLQQKTISAHFRVLKRGGFLVVNVADILAFPDPSMPRIQAPNLNKLRSPVTREQVLKATKSYPHYNRYQLAELLKCSEQTIDRRLNGNNIRGGKYVTQTRVQLLGQFIDQFAHEAGLYLYDRRIWVKDPTWANSQWHSSSYRSVNEYEDLYFFWKPGETQIDRSRLDEREWSAWGSRQVWFFPSVRSNDDHEAKFPLELPRRLVRLLTEKGETVLDCFMGSGTTAVAAILEDRHFIGIDIMPDYVRLSKKNIAKAIAERKGQLFPPAAQSTIVGRPS